MPLAEITTTFGAMLYQIRQRKRMSVAEASNHSGISAGYFSELENSKRKAPRRPIILKIAAGLNLSQFQTELLMRLADEDRCAHQISQPLSPELRSLIFRICQSAPELDQTATQALHAHLDSLRDRRCHSVQTSHTTSDPQILFTFY